jgi:hypothetical protein
MSEPEERQRFVSYMRSFEASEDIRERFRVIAGDILAEGLAHSPGDPVFDTLSDADREAYVADQARTLGPALLRASLSWGIFEFEDVATWRRHPRP